MEIADRQPNNLLLLTALIAKAYVGCNQLEKTELPALIAATMMGLHDAARGAFAPAAIEKPKPAVPIKSSIADDFIVCLEDGKKFKSLKRHLSVTFGLTPEAYRQRWNLPSDYPMVAPAYAAARAAFAKSIGLGQKGRGGIPAKTRSETRASAPKLGAKRKAKAPA